MARRIGRGVAIALGVIALLGVALFAVLQTPWAGRHLGNYLASRVNETIPGVLTIQALDLDGTTLELDGVTLTDPRGVVVGRIPRLFIDFAPLPLFSKRIVIEEIAVDAPYLRFVPAEPRAGVLAAVETPAARGGGGSALDDWAILLEDARVGAGHVEVIGPEGAKLAGVRGLSLHLAGARAALPGSFRFTFALSGIGEEKLAGPVIVRASGDGKLGTRGEHVIRGVELEHGRVRVDLADVLALAARTTGDDNVELKLERLRLAPALAQLWIPRWPLAAPVELSGRGELGPRTVAAKISARLASGEGFAHIEGSVARDWRRSPGGITVKVDDLMPRAIFGQGPRMPIDAEVEIASGSLAPRALSAKATLAAPATRWKGARWGPFDVRAAVAKGRLTSTSGQIALPGARLILGDANQAAPRPSAIEATVEVTSLHRLVRGMQRLGVTENADLYGRGKMHVALLGRPLEDGTRVGVAARGRFPMLRAGDLTARRLRFALTVPPAEAEARRGFALRASLAAPLELQVKAAGTRLEASEPQARPLLLALDRLELGYLARAGPVRWRLAGPARLGLGGTGLRAQNLRLREGAQRIAFETTPTRLGTHARAELSGVRIASVPRQIARGVRLPRGAVSGEVQVTTTRGLPVIVADLKMTDGSLRPVTIKNLRLGGDFTARLELSTKPEVPRLDLAGELAQVRFMRPTGAGAPVALFTGSGRISLQYRDGALDAGLALVEAGARAGELAAEARMDLDLDAHELAQLARDPNRRRHLRQRPIEGQLELRGFAADWLADLIGPIKLVRGRVAANLQIGGTLAEPEVAGTMRWRQGRVVVVAPAGS